jgi:lipopolysaccharide/colanic/teichoic acid biosynthesis glycosyltransferase
MNQEDLTTETLRRFTQAQTPWGRFLLRLHVSHQRVRASWLSNGTAFVKRFVDLLGSAALIILLTPLFALIALAIWIEDGGSIFFPQLRVGKFGRQFKMYKFRSMCPNAEQKLKALLAKNQHKEGVTFKLKDDPRITKVGKIMRKFSLDELPQFYNVFMGQMSLVGPRPPVPREVAKYTSADRRRLAVKPGITCIWQVSGRAEIDFSGQVELDVNYIETQSLSTDLKILVKTVPAVISGKGAC